MSVPVWEYDILVFEDDEDIKERMFFLNELGRDGWELVFVHKGCAYFKRRHEYRGRPLFQSASRA